MPTAMTYSSLLNDLRAYLERGATLATDPTVYEQLPRHRHGRLFHPDDGRRCLR